MLLSRCYYAVLFFSEVFHAKYRDYPGREVAMKKIRMENLKSNRVSIFYEILLGR